MDYNNSVHFLQSPAWQSFQQALGRQVITGRGDGWSYLAIIEKTHGIKRLYCPYGPTVDSEAALSAAIDDLKSAAKSHGAAYLRIQPLGIAIGEAQTARYKLQPIDHSQPSATWVVDLTTPLDSLFADMKQNTRNIVRNYHKKGLSYRTSQDPTDITHLLKLLHQVAEHNQISIHSDHYLTTQATSLLASDAAKLHFIDYQSEVIAAALTYQDSSTVYYAHAAADHQYRKLGASTALLGEILLHAKADGKSSLDLFGVTSSSDPQHAWAGFTRFKQSFGGRLLELSPTYELPIKPLLYSAYSQLRKLKHK